ncbi:hypothetical protein [Streptomyces silvisoli]|uniref:Ricin B lectin domain-containing protein n=1 Tax=Streptomyces silvisoli TaxID=3034235 RepID=A0ABT5ZWS7_9ACTN|nr:hypothetical protein [Streptomyces silvisoli]MDF3294275.1 hypothetical protein [Streptomyces silvisoli]
MKQQLRRTVAKAKAAAVVGILTVGALVGLPSTAGAAVQYNNVMLRNEASGQCMQANGQPGYDLLVTAPCDSGNQDQIWTIASVRPDAGSPPYANVAVLSSHGYCIRATALPWKIGYEMIGDVLCSGSWFFHIPDEAVFAMTPARPSQGHQHYENLFNFIHGVCVDGGFNAVYGFPKSGCNAPQGQWNAGNPNPWQVWDVYY